jgi:hypothetical protein
LAPGIYNFYQSVACCDSSSYSYVAIQSGSSWYSPGGAGAAFVIGMVYYNPTTDRCETISVSSSVIVPSFVITSANQGIYVYGSTNTSDTQCNRCIILGAHECSGSICYNWSFQNTNVSSTRNVYIVNCSGSAQTISVSPSSTVTTCSYATPIAEVPADIIITNLGVCGGTTTTTTAAPTTTTTTAGPSGICYNNTTVFFTSIDNINFNFGYTLCNGDQGTISGGTATAGSFTFDSSYCLRDYGIVAIASVVNTTVTGVSQSNQCGTYSTTTTTAAP